MPGLTQDLWSTVESLKGVFGGGADQQGWNSDQLQYIAKTFGISSSFVPYDLSQAAYYYQPVFCPLRNRLPRLPLQGVNMEFKAVTNVNLNNVSMLMAEGQRATSITTQFADVTTYFKAYGLASDPVTFEILYGAVARSGDFSVDARAVAAANLLKGVFLGEERLMLGAVGASTQVQFANAAPNDGLVFSIGGLMGAAPAGATVTGTVAPGGSFSSDPTVYLRYTAVTSNAIPNGMPANGGVIPYATSNAGESLPQAVEISVTLTGSQNAVIFTPPAYAGPLPVIGWKVYSATASGAEKYSGFTTGAPLTILTAGTGAGVPVADNSATPTATSITGATGSSVEGYFNGILPWLYATTSNIGSQGGAILQQINGSMTLDALQDGFALAFSTGFADPEELWFNAQDIKTLTKLLTGNNQGQPYWFVANQGPAQGDMVAGFKVGRFMNPVTGRIIPVSVHAYLPQGIAMALAIQLPPWFPGNNVPSVWTWGGNMDYLQIDYQPTPNTKQWLSEIECVGALHCFLPSQNIVFSGISAT